MKKIALASLGALMVSAGASAAATYSIDQLINITEKGFGSSVIHAQDYNGDMSGTRVALFDEAVTPGGMWAHDGDISWGGSIEGNAYTASGNIDTNGGGSLTFDIAGHDPFSGIWTFNFDGDLAMGLPNSFDGDVIYLWGDNGTCDSHGGGTCYGIDLRIAVSEMADVPLPASALLLLAGVGGLAGLRRRK